MSDNTASIIWKRILGEINNEVLTNTQTRITILGVSSSNSMLVMEVIPAAVMNAILDECN